MSSVDRLNSADTNCGLQSSLPHPQDSSLFNSSSKVEHGQPCLFESLSAQQAFTSRHLSTLPLSQATLVSTSSSLPSLTEATNMTVKNSSLSSSSSSAQGNGNSSIGDPSVTKNNGSTRDKTENKKKDETKKSSPVSKYPVAPVKTKTTRKKKRSSGPKAPTSAFSYFQMDALSEICKFNIDASVEGIMSIVQKQWEGLDDAARAVI